ncbi:hypothetical protein SLEP1_g48326 [Rubroshorea leprosula]|uniref:Uncharacterized protein n=1 Tax=Rubroshorea leprosula TaxID=152421 RepID=A0AAV5LW47_9ROSI|nr:hypothetical protein SLEP1_g48326 [Rubroshorea leprosula]
MWRLWSIRTLASPFWIFFIVSAQVEALTNQEEVELRSKIEALGLEVRKVPSKSIQSLDELCHPILHLPLLFPL